MKMINFFFKASRWLLVCLFPLALTAQDYESGFQMRAKLILDTLARRQQAGSGGFTCTGSGDYGKHLHPAFLGRLNQNPMDTVVANRMVFYANYCDMFHFNFPGLIRLLYLHPCNPAFTDQVKRLYLNQVFNRDDRYNAFTGEGTENHVNMNRTSAYLYAQFARDNFPSEYPTATARMTDAKEWALYFAKRIYEAGTGEWNSSTYHPYNINGWINLYDFAKDPEVKQAAKAVLDYYAAEVALYYTQGITGGANSRGSSVSSFSKEADYLGWLWYDDSPRNYALQGFVTPSGNIATQCAHFATSTYRPPIALVRLAQKRNLQDHYKLAYPTYLLDSIGYVQGDFYIDRDFTLGTAYTPYGGWSGGSTQILNWKLVTRVDSSGTIANNSAQILTGNGGYHIISGHPSNLDGQRRMPFDQYAQHKNVLIQMTKVPVSPNTSAIQSIFSTWQSAWLTDFIQRFPTGNRTNPVNTNIPNSLNRNLSFLSYRKDIASPATFEIDNPTNTLIIRYPKVYVTAKTIFRNQPVVTTTHSQYNYFRDTATAGNLVGFAVEVFNASDFTDYNDFKTKVLPKISLDKSDVANNRITYVSYNGDSIKVRFQESGTFTEPMFDWGYGPTTRQNIPKSPPFVQPTFPSGAPNGRLATWSVNNIAMNTYRRAIFKGKYLKLENSILDVNDSLGNCYRVDYSGSLPVFSTCDAPNQLPSDINFSVQLIADSLPADTFVGKLNAIDGDNDRHWFMLYDSSGNCVHDNAAFRISRDSVYSRKLLTAAEKNSWSFFVRADDNKGGYLQKAINLQLNLAPTNVTLTQNSIPENAPAGTFVGTLVGTDPNVPSVLTFALVSGPGDDDNSAFYISDNQLKSSQVFDFETKNTYTIRIRVTDELGLFFEKSFVINITDENEAPADIQLSSSSVAENSPVNTVVGVLTAVDVDASENFTFTLINGSGDTDNLLFNITGNQLLTSERFNFEDKNSRFVRIRVTDKGGLTFEKPFTIAIQKILAINPDVKDKVIILPNPAKDIVRISADGAISSVTLTNMQGRIVLRTERVSEIDISHLTSGTYLLRVVIDNQVFASKVVKE